MSKVNFNDINFGGNSVVTNSVAYSAQQGASVGFFSLKNDGDEAVVRFMHDSVDDFEIYNVHEVVVPGNKYARKVNCLREAHDPINVCPFCETKQKWGRRIIVHLIQYTKDANGNIVGEAKVWDRAIGAKNNIAQTLKSYMDNYGPLSDIMCKIIRHGVAGSQDTHYEIVPNLSKQIFRDDIYVKDTTLFEGYSALGRIIMNKNAEAMQTYLSTGEFPAFVPKADYVKQMAQNNDTVPAANHVSEPVSTAYNASNSSVDEFSSRTRVSDAPTNQPAAQPKESASTPIENAGRPVRFDAAPWETATTNNASAATNETTEPVERPRRFY